MIRYSGIVEELVASFLAGELNSVQVDAEVMKWAIYVNYKLISTNHVPYICPGHTTTDFFLQFVPNL